MFYHTSLLAVIAIVLHHTVHFLRRPPRLRHTATVTVAASVACHQDGIES
jgi:hypothetical protein